MNKREELQAELDSLKAKAVRIRELIVATQKQLIELRCPSYYNPGDRCELDNGHSGPHRFILTSGRTRVTYEWGLEES